MPGIEALALQPSLHVGEHNEDGVDLVLGHETFQVVNAESSWALPQSISSDRYRDPVIMPRTLRLVPERP
jgi:hypothetical protein